MWGEKIQIYIPPAQKKNNFIIKMAGKYSKKKKRSYGKRRYNKSTRKRYKRKGMRRKRADTGTFLKVSSTAIPVVLNNKSAATGANVLTPDTFQHALAFNIGNSITPGDQSTIQITNEVDIDTSFPQTNINCGTSLAHQGYEKLYKYVQFYKIVVKFYPTITEGGTLSTDPASVGGFSNAISGQVTTDIERDEEDYGEEYPASLDGQLKSMSRKVARNHNILKPWTRTFTPSKKLLVLMSNPKSEYQYTPKEIVRDINEMGDQKFIIRMRIPQAAGFVAPNLDSTELDFPPVDNFVRFGTLQATAYIKYIQPFN